VALAHGGRGIVAASLDAVEQFASAEGFEGRRTVETIRAFNARTRNGWEALDLPRAEVCAR
jgi:hypothetical protein